MADEVQGAGGTVEKFAGDAVMAVFGVPEALEDHAERALHAALAMQRRHGTGLRIGVNTGEVVVGPEPMRRTGRCLAYGEGITYWPLGEVLKEHLGILDSDPPEVVLRRLGGREILGLTLGLDLAGDVHPLAARDRLHEAWIAFLSGLAAERPVVLLVEDVHWAEDPLLELLERLA